GRRAFESVEELGRFVIFCASTVRWLISDAFKFHNWRLVWPQFYEVGTRSIPVVMLTGAFIGMVLAVEMFAQFEQFGQEDKLGGVIGISVVKHLGPVLAAVMLAGRVGGAFAAEIGTMTVTEQVEALRVMGAAPISHLVVPRVIACVIMIPILTIFSDILGVAGSWMIGVGMFEIPNNDYWAQSARIISKWDLTMGLVKSVFFGLAIGLISCHKGFRCERGAQGVGEATTSAFVTSFVTIIVLNFFLAKFQNDLYLLLYGQPRPLL
ncbi:MAG: ABC transporter permease, partial [Phycisphaeraceae bacterium]|nr:ABC transporter permease [Phycisphaeraceae bacterium]